MADMTTFTVLLRDRDGEAYELETSYEQ